MLEPSTVPSGARSALLLLPQTHLNPPSKQAYPSRPSTPARDVSCVFPSGERYGNKKQQKSKEAEKKELTLSAFTRDRQLQPFFCFLISSLCKRATLLSPQTRKREARGEKKGTMNPVIIVMVALTALLVVVGVSASLYRRCCTPLRTYAGCDATTPPVINVDPSDDAAKLFVHPGARKPRQRSGSSLSRASDRPISAAVSECSANDNTEALLGLRPSGFLDADDDDLLSALAGTGRDPPSRQASPIPSRSGTPLDTNSFASPHRKPPNLSLLSTVAVPLLSQTTPLLPGDLSAFDV